MDDLPAAIRRPNSHVADPVSGLTAPKRIGPATHYRTPLAAVVVGLAYLLFYRATLWIHTGHTFVVWLTTLASLFLTLLVAVQVARAELPLRWRVISAIILALFAVPLVGVPILAARLPAWPGWTWAGPAYVAYRRRLAFVPGLDGLILIWLAADLGVLLSELVREIKLLLPIAVVLALVDLYVVFGRGLVSLATRGSSQLAQVALQTLTVKLPTMHPQAGAAPMRLAVGFADFLFIGMFFACLSKFRVPARGTFVVLYCILAVYMVLVSYVGPLPALVPISLTMVGMNVGRFRFSRAETFALLYAAVIVGAVAGGLFLFARL